VAPASSKRLSRFFPGVATALSYQRAWLTDDLVAGLVLTAVLVPQGMAYAQLAGLPPVTGLYTTTLALIAYALFGPSPILVVGPDSSLGPLIAATVLPLVAAGGDPGRAVGLAGMLAILMGLLCSAAGLARAGMVADLLSKPVRVGYLNGIAVVVIASQLPTLFGVPAAGSGTIGRTGRFLGTIGSTNPTSLAIGVGCLVLILWVRARRPRVPAVLLAVGGATLAVIFFDLGRRGITLVGPVPRGFPTPSFPSISAAELSRLAAAAVGMAFVTLADTTALSRVFSAQVGKRVDPNQEMIALGAANIAAGIFQGFPVSASSSRTAVAKTAGAHSQLTGLVGAGMILVILAFAHGLTTSIPSASLAAVVIAAGIALFDLGELTWLWRVRRSEFWLSLSALLGVVLIGVLEGIAIAVALSLGNFIRRAWRPHDAVLGRLAGRKGYHDTGRHPDAALIPGLVLYRFDAPVFFANAEHFARRVQELISQSGEPVNWVVVAAEPVTDIDSTGAEVLTRLLTELEAEGIKLAFAELKGPVKDRLQRYGLLDLIGSGSLFPTVGTAVSAYLAESGVAWHDPVEQPPPSVLDS
jgi:high affinity sulfate transporter 1